MKRIGYLVDPAGTTKAVEIPNSLEGYYELLDCETIDIVKRRIGGKYYDIVCDDEGLFKDDIRISAVDSRGDAMLVGKLLICNNDGNGHESGLTQDDIQRIEACVRKVAFVRGVEY